MKSKVNICPFCGLAITAPLNLITSQQVKKIGLIDHISVDEVLQRHTESYGGVIESESQFKQIVYPDGQIPDTIRRFVRGNRIKLQIGEEEINQKACDNCHSNITPILDDSIKEVINVMLIGPPGASKTTLLASAIKFASELHPKNKPEKIISAMSPKSFEHEFYAKKTAKFPYIGAQTNHNSSQFNRQPLFFIRTGQKLLIFHDYPGEALKESAFSIPDNAVPVYLYDYSADKNMQLAFFNTKIMELHDGNKTYKKEIIALTKCDTLDQQTVRSIMLMPYEKSGFKSFSSLLAARRRAFSDRDLGQNIEMFSQLSSYCDNIDAVCVAALGCDTEATEDGKYRLSGPWDPQYIYDTLLTIGG
ncbi:MAG: hypothetical protein Q4A05_09030 [Ruminococcus sp.]|nr:hypothetical protein [Ruminococcus sp.]